MTAAVSPIEQPAPWTTETSDKRELALASHSYCQKISQQLFEDSVHHWIFVHDAHIHRISGRFSTRSGWLACKSTALSARKDALHVTLAKS